jgi:hypothetical protein
VTVTTATAPLVIVPLFIPQSRQVCEPALPEHSSVLPAAVAAGPAATVREAIWDGE